jgi:hypothetical protein
MMMFTSVAISKIAKRWMSLTNIAYIIAVIHSISVIDRMDCVFIVLLTCRMRHPLVVIDID